MPALPEDIRAEAGLRVELVGAIARAVLQQLAQEPAVVAEDVQRDFLRLESCERLDAWRGYNGPQLAIAFHLKRLPYDEDEVGDAIVRPQHRGEDGVEFRAAHGRKWRVKVKVECRSEVRCLAESRELEW